MWLGSSASDGASLSVEIKNCETRMMAKVKSCNEMVILQGIGRLRIHMSQLCLQHIGTIARTR